MKIVFIRHGHTAGNLEKRYIGSTDGPLCGEGIAELKKMHYPQCEKLICSPMKRCIQTAELLFPTQEINVCQDLRECDFGDFEGKNYNDLYGNSEYQDWIDSGGKLPFPHGEAPDEFRKRCVRAFDKIIAENSECKSLFFILHGGPIMSVLEKYAVPRMDYFSWHCENGHGYICSWNGSELTITERI